MWKRDTYIGNTCRRRSSGGRCRCRWCSRRWCRWGSAGRWRSGRCCCKIATFGKLPFFKFNEYPAQFRWACNTTIPVSEWRKFVYTLFLRRYRNCIYQYLPINRLRWIIFRIQDRSKQCPPRLGLFNEIPTELGEIPFFMSIGRSRTAALESSNSRSAIASTSARLYRKVPP